MAKVIGVSNFDLDNVSDVLVASNLTDEEAKSKASYLNNRPGAEQHTYYYKSVPGDHKLYKFEP